MSAASKRHMGRVAELGCCTCGQSPVEVHHARTGEAAGAAQRPSDWLTIPLCPDCHRGKMGVHGDRTMLRITKKTELQLVGETLEALYG
jgi:hypothetical protein